MSTLYHITAKKPNPLRPHVFAISDERRRQLITWLEKRFYPVEGKKLTQTQYSWRMGNNKVLADVIALLKYDGEYRLNTPEETLNSNYETTEG